MLAGISFDDMLKFTIFTKAANKTVELTACSLRIFVRKRPCRLDNRQGRKSLLGYASIQIPNDSRSEYEQLSYFLYGT